MKELLQLGSWERFPAMPRGVLVSSCGRLVCSVAKWVPRSIVFASGVDSVCGPLTNEEVGRGPSGPVASRPPLGVSMHWSSTHGGLASGFSGSLPSRFERLVSLQGASDSMAHFSPEGVVVISGSGIAVRALLLATSLTLTMVLPLAPGQFCPSLPFPDGSLSLRCLF